MTLPTATYRLQFRQGMDFDRAAGLATYLANLGVSHLYASPLFQATPGSTHGYDVTDHARFDESLGGISGFKRLSAALKGNGLGLVVDIVPNHMAASPENPWWRDVLRYGSTSVYAGHFDVDWSAPRLILPVLGRPYGAALEAGEFALGFDQEGLTWRYFDHTFPLDPQSWEKALTGAAPPAEPADFARWSSDADNAAKLAADLDTVSKDRSRLHNLHEAQPWRLMYWRAARDSLTYRRFFEISDLVGVRVEEPGVFDDVHRFLFDLIDAGHIDGVRVDHVDGLADPGGYLHRLHRELPRDVPIWVEKILARGEVLPAGWPVAGTTGYELADSIGRVLTSAGAEAELDRAYTAFTAGVHDYDAMSAEAKREILTRNLATELQRLTELASNALAGNLVARDWGPDSIRRSIIALMVAMPVYRTYLTASETADTDRTILDRVIGQARQDRSVDDAALIDAVAALLIDGQREAAGAFMTRFQQTSGALMAKAIEDTLFYRFHRLVSANEVGGEPRRLGLAPARFHAEMSERVATQPDGLSTTATHDTKRGEDARMRIAAISEASEVWAAAVRHFDTILASEADLPSVDAETRWLFFQALLGSWRPTLDDDLLARLSQFLLKAAREAKRHTSWVRQDADYERLLAEFAGRALACQPFLDAFAPVAARFIWIGERKSLVQVALKLTVPGIPDIYQGCELADLSFVDPDNRRPIDFALRQDFVKKPLELSEIFDEHKIALLRFGLALRRDHPDIFAGPYRPLPTPDGWGPRAMAFAREGTSKLVVVAADVSGGESPLSGDAAVVWDFSKQCRLVRAFPPAPLDTPLADYDFRTNMRNLGVAVCVVERIRAQS